MDNSLVRIYSLRGLLLSYNLAFLLLIIVTGAMGGIGIELRQQAAEESARLNTLLALVQETRGEVYRQMTEVFDHHFLGEPLAVLRYRSISQRLDSKFLSLNQIATLPLEQEAVEALILAYEQLQVQTNEMMSVPSSAIRDNNQVTVFFTGNLEMMWLDDYEEVFAANDSLMRVAQSIQNQQSNVLARNTLLIILVPIGLAAIMLLSSGIILNRFFVRPVADLLYGFLEFGRGKLDYKVKESGASELVKLQKAVNRMATDLAESREALIRSEKQAALGSLIPVVAHNIRNPLASIRATAQLHDDAKLPTEVSHGLKDITVTVDRLEQWLSSLLNYLNPLSLERTKANLSDLVDQSLSLLTNVLVQKSIIIEKFGWESNSFVMADIYLFEQAIYGLILNAVQASPEGSKIILSLKSENNNIYLTIRDYGSGMPFNPNPEDLNPGPTTKSFGSGLGIPFAFKVCDLHDGKVEFSSSSEGGAEVMITLPLV